jgi:hypothetical protein
MLRTALALLLATLPPCRAAAQSLTLSPAVVQLRGATGQSTTQALTLHNGTDLDLAFALEAQDVVVRDGKRAFVDAGEIAGSIAATAVFSQRTLAVPAGATRTVELTVTLPPSATTRAVVAMFRGITKIRTGRTEATASIGTLITFTLSDRISFVARDLVVRPQSPAVNAALVQTLSNDGTEPIVPKGAAVVLDPNGAVVARMLFQFQRLLPGEQATLRAEYSGELPRGSYRAVASFDVGGRILHRSAELVVP